MMEENIHAPMQKYKKKKINMRRMRREFTASIEYNHKI
jgi:hypothetical protein